MPTRKRFMSRAVFVLNRSTRENVYHGNPHCPMVAEQPDQFYLSPLWLVEQARIRPCRLGGCCRR